MNDLDDLRAALNEPPDFTPRALDLAAVMTTGGRIRRRRRLAIATTSGLAVVALLIGGNLLTQRAPDERVSPPVAAATSTAPTIVSTGIKTGDGEWVFYLKPAGGTETAFGVMLGVAVPGQEPEDAVMANETSGSPTSPGFHAGQGSMGIDQGVTPTFGYYAGPAAKITAEVDGKTVTAAQAPLGEQIQVYWFEGGGVTNLAAYGADGTKLPTGNAEIGVG